MNIRLSQTILLLLVFQLAQAQPDNHFIEKWEGHVQNLVKLVRNDNVKQLANFISYPLRRPNPLPDIKNKEAFILYYPTLFDAECKKKLLSFDFEAPSYVDRDEEIGLFDGEFWINVEGKITAVNLSGKQELALQKKLTDEALSQMHPSVKKWEESILVLKSDKFLIRIDVVMGDGLRYVSWKSPKKTSDKPDLILLNGDQMRDGTAGAMIYTFINGDWKYEIQDDSRYGSGIQLVIYQNEKEVSRQNFKVMK